VPTADITNQRTNVELKIQAVVLGYHQTYCTKYNPNSGTWNLDGLQIFQMMKWKKCSCLMFG